MANPSRRTGPDEVVVFRTRQHWLVLLRPVLSGAAILLGGSVLWSLMPGGALQEALRFVVIALCIGLLLWWVLPPIARWAGTRLIVTDRRLLYRRRPIGRFTRDVPLDQLTEVAVVQSLLERMAGTGDLVMRVAGEPGRINVADVPRPDRVRELIGRQVQGLHAPEAADWERTPPQRLGDPGPGRAGVPVDPAPGELRRVDPDGTAGTGPASGVVQQLQHLADLRDRGVVSNEEFQRIKEDLLRRM
ncbi:MAG TPA: PH domain-containing protein [Actinomycetes bacterium]|nr:PH domain-containing protein [Actinomycetes bacterium]